MARRSDDDPFVTDRFEFFVGRQELANGFSELNDAEDRCFKHRLRLKRPGTMRRYTMIMTTFAPRIWLTANGGRGDYIDRLMIY